VDKESPWIERASWSASNLFKRALTRRHLIRPAISRPASQDHAKILFDCQMADDPAMIN
jgi:hypothetical protein